MGFAVSSTCTKPSVWQVGRRVSPTPADDGSVLGLGQVPSAQYPLAGAVGEAFPVVLSPGSAAMPVWASARYYVDPRLKTLLVKYQSVIWASPPEEVSYLVFCKWDEILVL